MEEREKGTIRAGKVSAVTVTSGQLFLLLVVLVVLKSFQQLSSSFSVSQVSQFGKLFFFPPLPLALFMWLRPAPHSRPHLPYCLLNPSTTESVFVGHSFHFLYRIIKNRKTKTGVLAW